VTGRQFTLVMAKPDAMRRPEVLADIGREIDATGLAVESVLETTLSRAEAAALFPAFDEIRYPITRALLKSYLTAGPVRFTVLSGPGAIAAGRKARKAVRARHAVAALANCLHVSADSAEATHQLRWLAANRGLPAAWAESTGAEPAAPPVPLVPGVFGALAEADFDRLGQAVWAAVEELGWADLWSLAPAPGEWVTTLKSDDQHSLDYAVSALHEELPTLPADHALRAVLSVDVLGAAPVFAGDADAARRLTERLNGRGLVAETA
jgi:nucleoside diphosphate kinase